jgi:DNA-directed RNA polymerase specialized sigma24 family protein
MTTQFDMRCRSLSELIGQGFEDAIRQGVVLPGGEAPLPEAEVQALPRLMHDPAQPLWRQDQFLDAVIRLYRATGDPGWSAVLLEMLAPMLTAADGCFIFMPDGVSREDVQQQLIVESLHAARFMRLPEPPRDVQGRLRRRTLRRTASWLRRGIRSQGESLERLESEGAAFRDADQLFLIELRDSGVSGENLALLYRSQVLGLTARELAVEMGISIDAVYMRQRRALRRLRRWAPTQFRRFAGAFPAAA